MIPLTKLHDEKEGFLVNGYLVIVAEVDVLAVIATLDESEESEESRRPVKKSKHGGGEESIDSLKEAHTTRKSNTSDRTSDRYFFGRIFPTDFQQNSDLVRTFRQLQSRQKTVGNFRPFTDGNNLKYYPSEICRKSVENF